MSRISMAPPRETLRFSGNKINRFPPDQSFTESCLKNSTKCLNCCKMYSYILYIIQLSSEGEVNSGEYIPRRFASWYTSTILDKTVEKIIYLGRISLNIVVCTGSFLSPLPWKQCFCIFKRKPDPWAFVGRNIHLSEGNFFPQSRRFGNSFVA